MLSLHMSGVRIGVGSAMIAGSLSWIVLSAQGQRPPQFRGGVTLVPIEVRAVDKDGRPVSDLTAADFVIREAGQREDVAHFRTAAVETSGGETGRTFFIILGRGRLNNPTGALQALVDFVRKNLQPHDRVGLFAYLRTIDPTTDHASVAAFLERYRDQHERIEGLLRADVRHYLLPLPPVLGTDTLAALDRLFQPGQMSRDLAGATGAALGRFNSFNFLRRSFEYLRSFDGEKHAIMVSEELPGIARIHNDPLRNFWFRTATDARASLSYIHAGGLGTSGMSRGGGLTRGGGIDPARIDDHALLAAQTGGVSAFYQFAAEPLALLDRVTRFHYVLGYYPTRQVAGEQYRHIEIAVTRPGVRLLYRQGYVAQPPAERSGEYRHEVTESRLGDGAARILNPRPMPFILAEPWQIRLRSPSWTASGDGGRVHVGIAFDARHASVVKNGDAYLTDIDLLLIADDSNRNVLAERRFKLNIRLSAADFARTKREWLQYEAALEMKTRPAYLRAVLYDFETDRTASTQIRLDPQASPQAVIGGYVARQGRQVARGLRRGRPRARGLRPGDAALARRTAAPGRTRPRRTRRVPPHRSQHQLRPAGAAARRFAGVGGAHLGLAQSHRLSARTSPSA